MSDAERDMMIEETLMIVDEHLSRVDYSMGRIRQLARELKGITRATDYRPSIDEAVRKWLPIDEGDRRCG